MLTIEMVDGGGLRLGVEAVEALPADVELAARRAINKTANWFRTQVARTAAQDLGVRVGDIRNRVQVIGATKGTAHAVLRMSTRAAVLPVAALSGVRQTRAGVRAGKRSYRGAFLATVGLGRHLGVFRRKGSARLPINQQYVWVGAPTMAAIRQVLDAGGEGYLLRAFERELDHLQLRRRAA